MAQYRPHAGARVPLFDRLVDDAPKDTSVEPRPLRILEGRALHESLQRDVARLFNTQRPLRIPNPDNPGTVLDYGIPDLISRSLKQSVARRRLCLDLADALRAFEPRIADPEVAVVRTDDHSQSMVVEVRGVLTVGTVGEPLAFPVTVFDLYGREDD